MTTDQVELAREEYERQELIAAANATEAPNPMSNGGTAETITDPGTGDSVEVGMGARVISAPQYFPIYNRFTGKESRVPGYMLAPKLKERYRGDLKEYRGKRLFTTRKSDIVRYASRGVLKCYLHVDHENRAYYTSIGLGNFSCGADHIPTIVDLEQHMQKKHGKEWAVMAAAERRQTQEEEREYRRVMLRNAGGEVPATPAPTTAPVAMAETPVPVAYPEIVMVAPGAAPSAATTTEEPASESSSVIDAAVELVKVLGQGRFTEMCVQCDTVIRARSQTGAKSRLRKHEGDEHPGG
jgi:hypothetical protein